LLGTDSALIALIIHEIAHAVAGVDHAKTWRHRLECAAAKAEKKGMLGVAEDLRGQIVHYSDPLNDRGCTAPMFYQALTITVFDNPDIAFEEAMKRTLFGTQDLETKIKLFKRSRKVYDRAKKILLKAGGDKERAFEIAFPGEGYES
jgi:hypothetical protein